MGKIWMFVMGGAILRGVSAQAVGRSHPYLMRGYRRKQWVGLRPALIIIFTLAGGAGAACPHNIFILRGVRGGGATPP